MNQRIVSALLALALGFAMMGTWIAFARAHDSHRPDLDQWFNGLKSNYGLCCSFVDGTAVLDADWESSEGHYRVRIEGKWYDVPDQAVLDVPNRYGPAIVWRYRDNATSDWKIRCFIPGAGT